MTNWNKLLQALNQTFNSQTGAASTVKPVHRAFDNTTQEYVIWLEYRVKANILESDDFRDGLKKQGLIEQAADSRNTPNCTARCMVSQLPIYPRYITALDLQFHFEERESSRVKALRKTLMMRR